LNTFKVVLVFYLMFHSGCAWAQAFPQRGQQPATAFPVCGEDTFRQSKIPFGANGAIDYAACHKPLDFCPFYYSFTCYVAGTLGFVITPDSANTDYDWMLFDITGHSPEDIYKTLLVVTGNWSGTYGLTGAKDGGSTHFECGSEPALNHPTFSTMPTLIKGHHYLLLISNFSETSSGYKLSFGGGTAVLNDPVPPHLQSAFVGCDKSKITVVLDKKVTCGSLASDGSDFILASGSNSVTGATGLNCDIQFDADSIQLTLGSPLLPGNYSIQAKSGTDGNTLLDDCGTPLASGENAGFTTVGNQETPMDSVSPVKCAPQTIQLIFSSPMQCGSLAADGSDFNISGSAPVTITKASAGCSNGLTTAINLELASPIETGGNYLVTLNTGSDGNSILNACGIATHAGSSVPLDIKDTVSAAFDYNIAYGCRYDTINILYQTRNGVNQWQWENDGQAGSPLAEPSFAESIFETKQIMHIVSNGFCSDTVSRSVELDNALKAGFQSADEVCPKKEISFKNASSGSVVAYHWDFGDGTSSNLETPPDHLFPDTWAGKTYAVSLSVKNNLGCYDTAVRQILKMQSCYLTVPNAFTPNGDGLNDYLYPLNAFSATDLDFQVFNRYGQLVFETHDWTRKWDGTMSGVPQESGTYIWVLRYTDNISGKNFFLRGTSVLIR
jgi:gliding motility-associated-like protein